MTKKGSLPALKTAPAAPLTDGTLVLEGGAFRGVYTAGVCDVLLENGIRLRNVAGISSGSMNGMNYMADQIGRTVRIQIGHLSDKRFLGWRALLRDRGMIGFSFMMKDAFRLYPFDKQKLADPERRFTVGATDCETGEEVCLERTNCSDMEKACVASSSLLRVSHPVTLDGRVYVDGGYAQSVLLPWAKEIGGKTVVVLTAPEDQVRTQHEIKRTRFLRRYPALLGVLENGAERYNAQRAEIRELEKAGKAFVIAPTERADVKSFDRDPEKLIALYELGREDAARLLPALREYLNG